MELLPLRELKSHDQIKREPDTDLADYNQQVPEIYSDPKQRRRAQNRKAARKFREKKRYHANNIMQDYEKLQKENNRLRQTVDTLTQNNNLLEDKIQNISKVTGCTCNVECNQLTYNECEEYFRSLENLPDMKSMETMQDFKSFHNFSEFIIL